MDIKAVLQKSRAALYMILVQLFLTGMMVLSKVILNHGVFIFALLTYRQIVAAIFLAPLSFFLERVTMALGLYYYGLRYTTATYASTFLNLVPIVTFVFSTVLGIEKLGLRTIGGRVKVVGTILCVAGAIVITLYRGKPLHMQHSHAHNDHNSTKKITKEDMVHGSLLLVGSCLGSAAWFISQVKVFKVFPSTYWATMLSCLAGGIQSSIIGIALQRRKSAWRLGWDLNLLTIIYSGVLTTGVSFCLIQWAVANRGPTYPPMFNPLLLVFVAILESLFMGEELFVGSILGMVLIIGGLYAFLWGKKNQLKANKMGTGDAALAPGSTQSSTTVTPVNVGDITLVLETAQASSIISPTVDQQEPKILSDNLSEKEVGIQK
ncbi:WAT1-related-like protein isoform X2 [Cinnamomum micranthum f. kanehirae]|uniref:WAT1-related protein n=1 Tax=Cinnamomum micranthum f. kanehirae TaxID=337451 RepID=A0A3S3Q8W4_9MAGN|nr:WAT1-related-like protein isoform X2 [Cinnamomum micranthum f. kanehirae]